MSHRLATGGSRVIADLGEWIRLLLAGLWLMLVNGCSPAPDAPDTSISVNAPNHVAESTAPAVKPSPPATGFIGSARCAECHADISEDYAEHPMARSAGLIAEVSTIENYDASEFASKSWRYRAERTDQGVFHHEILPGPNDAPLYDYAAEVHYAIGSGQRGRTYLTDRDGFLFESPITWYSSGKRWDLSPGYAGLNQHFERQIGDGCLFCHVGTLNGLDGQPHRYRRPMFLEPGIGCERCHGPAADHVAYHEARRSEPDVAAIISDSIINPRRLDPERREAVCNQCHLQGDERILRSGRHETDFRPGDLLHDIWISFTRGTRVQEGVETDVVSQVAQMQASRCYEASDGHFGCTSCHDPHRVPRQEQVADYYRQKCMTCHAPPRVECRETAAARDVEQNSCIACHLPKLRATDVPHTSQTDHRILRRPGKPVPAEAGGQSPFQIFGNAAADVPEWEIQRARGLLMMDYAERKRERILAAQALELLKPLVDRAETDPVLWTKLGVGYELANYPDLARQAWTKAMELDSTSPEPQRRLAVLLFDRYSLQDSLSVLEESQSRFPWDQRVLGRLVVARASAGRLDNALELAQQGVKQFPVAVQLHQWLADLYRSQGQTAQSQRHAEIVKALQRAR